MGHVQHRRALLGLGLAVAWGIGTACSSFSGDSTPPPSEAGADAPGSVEASTSNDATASTRFCKTGDAAVAAFCADFDDGPVDAGWPLTFVTGGHLETTPSDRSAPNALLATVDSFVLVPTDAGADAEAGAAQPFGSAVLSTTLGRGGKTGAVLDLDMRIDELPPLLDGSVTGAVLATMGFDADTQVTSLSYYEGKYYFAVRDPSIKGGEVLVEVAVPRPPRWFHVRMVTHFDGSSAELLFDGIQVAAAQGLASPLLGLFVGVGPSLSTLSGKARVAYDNVTLTLL